MLGLMSRIVSCRALGHVHRETCAGRACAVQGGFAVVHKAKYTPYPGAAPEVVAVKILKPEVMTRRKDVDGFLHEGSLLRKLQHKWVGGSRAVRVAVFCVVSVGAGHVAAYGTRRVIVVRRYRRQEGACSMGGQGGWPHRPWAACPPRTGIQSGRGGARVRLRHDDVGQGRRCAGWQVMHVNVT